MSNFNVLTCLACGKRTLFEFMHYQKTHINTALKKGCECGKNEFVMTGFTNYANAQKLAAMPLKPQFKLMYQALESKREVVKLVIEMIDTLMSIVKKAELNDDTEPLKEVVKWLKHMTVRDANDLPEGLSDGPPNHEASSEQL